MKRIILSAFLIFFVSGNIFAQSKPVEALRNFWSMALSNNFESARDFVISTRQTQEFKYKQIQNSFQIVFQNKLQIPELNTSQVFPESAYFNFQIEKAKKKFKGQALLIKQNGEWKILLFDVTPMSEVKSLPIFTPSPDFPAPKKCSICG